MVCFWVPPAQRQDVRDAVFVRMREEGLLRAAMYAFAKPELADWRRLTNPQYSWLLLALNGGDEEKGEVGEDDNYCDEEKITKRLMAAALLTPWRGEIWKFDFTVFRAHFGQALPLAHAGLGWIFEHAPCTDLLGLCPVPNRHAWRLAEAAGFRVLGRVPGGCLRAGKGRVDAVLLWAVKPDLAPPTKPCQ